MTIRFNNKFGKEILRRYDARQERTRPVDLFRALRRSASRIARKGEAVADGACRQTRRYAISRFEMGNGADASVDRNVARACRCAQSQKSKRRFAQRISLLNNPKKIIFVVDDNLFKIIIDSVESDGVRLKFFDRPRRRRVLDRSRRRRRAFFLAVPFR